MRTKLFTIPLYQTALYVVVGRDVTGEWLYNHVAKKFGEKIPKLKTEVGGCEGSCNAQNGLIVVFLSDLKDMGLLAHECLHAVVENMKHVDLPLTHESEEAWTYLIGWMVDTIRKWGAK